jgi:hypothetical protein
MSVYPCTDERDGDIVQSANNPHICGPSTLMVGDQLPVIQNQFIHVQLYHLSGRISVAPMALV